jgi:hypothetical protein
MESEIIDDWGMITKREKIKGGVKIILSFFTRVMRINNNK